MKRESFLVKIWNVVWPLFIYIIAQSVVTVLGIGFLGTDFEYALVFVLIAAILCVPIYYHIYRKDLLRAGEKKHQIPMNGKDYVSITLCGAMLALLLNNVIQITPLPVWFPGYQETNEVIYGGSLFLQILAAGIFGCMVEEVSMRGVTYLRMKRYWGKKKALFFSALVFGIYHMNVVQGVYAFGLGLFFAWLYERYESLWAPIVAHMSANLFVLLFGSSRLMTILLSEKVTFCVITCVAMLFFCYGWRYMKQSNPLVELEFVEKEPDTLKKLTEEYKEQEKGESES